MINETETTADIINEIAIKRMIEAGYRTPVLDCIRETDEFLSGIDKENNYDMVI